MKPCEKIILWGPPAIDWLNISHEQPGIRPPQSRHKQREVFLSAQPGGVALLRGLLRAMCPINIATISLHVPDNCKELMDDNLEAVNTWEKQQLDPRSMNYRRTWSLWQKRGEPWKGDEPAAYRMDPAGITNWERGDFTLGNPLEQHTGSSPTFLLLDDPGSCNSSNPKNRERVALLSEWLNEKYLNDRNVSELLLRLDSRSLGARGAILQTSDLCRHLMTDDCKNILKKKTTVLTTVRNLRRHEVRIGAPLSWERMFDDVVQAAQRCFKNKFKRIIVTIGLAGAVVIEEHDGKPLQTLVFDHHRQDGDLEAKLQGRVLGSSTCMMAALAMARVEDLLTWPQATHVGLEMMRELSWCGYIPSNLIDRPTLKFPEKQLSEMYYQAEHFVREARENPTDGFSVRDYRSTFPKGDLETFQRWHPQQTGDDSWTILGYESSSVLERAKNIVRRGAKTLQNVPVECVNNWYSADRSEIEGVRSVLNAIQDYLSKKGETKPLSIAVFGPPGAGKSYVIREIAKKLGINDHLTFNLSQFKSPAELAEAYHQARDRLLTGSVPPLVFWDEFDSPFGTEQLGWLRFFLSPMQDGQFTDGGAIHPVGRGIYIFAGGTKPSFKEFTKTSDDPDLAYQDRSAKKPDFISRLRAYIDVKGPDPTPVKDMFFMIRRAFLLRSCLERDARNLRQADGFDDCFDLDEGVLNAFLQTKSYQHGARSMENIVRLSTFEDKTKYELSSLPPEHLLEMHVVDVVDFLKHAQVVEELPTKPGTPIQ
jgi:hypothetical protein